MSEKNNLKNKIESLLFVSLKPLSVGKIARILEVSKEKVLKKIDELARDLDERDSGIRLIRSGEYIELGTDPKNFPIIKRFLSGVIKEELTPAALEALTIIAYKGPITEEEISFIRGVNSQIILGHLLRRDLILKKGEPPRYIVSPKFLRHLGIKSVEELPDYKEYNQLEINMNQV